MTDKQMLDDFQAWLEDHNYCKVTQCIDCRLWGDSEMDKKYYPLKVKHCRFHKIPTWPDDYCSDAVEVKHEN